MSLPGLGRKRADMACRACQVQVQEAFEQDELAGLCAGIAPGAA